MVHAGLSAGGSIDIGTRRVHPLRATAFVKKRVSLTVRPLTTVHRDVPLRAVFLLRPSRLHALHASLTLPTVAQIVFAALLESNNATELCNASSL
jgi:hypothetical protein